MYPLRLIYVNLVEVGRIGMGVTFVIFHIDWSTKPEEGLHETSRIAKTQIYISFPCENNHMGLNSFHSLVHLLNSI